MDAQQQTSTKTAPVVTIDGPSGVGKGTTAQLLAKRLGWHYLDSGAIYRALAWATIEEGLSPEQTPEIVHLLDSVTLEIDISELGVGISVSCNGIDISKQIRDEAVAMRASQISAVAEVRSALLQRQRDMRRPPGLVTDGRDMGTVVFADAEFKFFLTASTEERALRRYNQLKEQGINVSLPDIQSDLEARDQRDQEREVCPTKPADDAVVIDTTHLSIDEVLEKMIAYMQLGS